MKSSNYEDYIERRKCTECTYEGVLQYSKGEWYCPVCLTTLIKEDWMHFE